MEIEDLEIPCVECGQTGKGKYSFTMGKKVYSGRVPCNTCNGTGKILSDKGYRLLDFLQKYLSTNDKIKQEISDHEYVYHYDESRT